MSFTSRFIAVLTVAVLLVGLAAPAASAAAVPVSATVETAPIHGSGDAADDPAIWIHPSDPSQSTIIGTDKSTDGRGLVVYDLSGRELFYYPDGRMNNVDVRYNFPLGSNRVGLVGASNRARSLDFYKVNETDRSLTKVGSFAPTANIGTPRGFSFYHSPETGKYFAYVTDIGKVEQWELDGSTGSVTGRLVRSWTVSGPAHTEGLVADDEMKRLYIAQEDIGGIWRYGAEPGDSTAGTKVVSTIENGGDIIQDIKGISIYYGSGGAGYLLAASQGSNQFHVYSRDDNRPLGAFAIPAGNGIDAVTGMDGIDVTNFGVGGPFPQGFFVTQDHANDNGLRQNFKVVPWQSIAAAYAPALLVDAAYDPRKIGAGPTTPSAPDTTITSKPANPTNSTSAQFSFTSTSAGATFACSLDSAAFVNCTSPASYAGLSDGAHTFQVQASDQNGVDPTPASHTWTVDTTPPEADTTAPTVTGTSPAANATGVAVSANVTGTFSEAMDTATITPATFTLTTATGTTVSAAVTYDSPSRVATLSPDADLAAGTAGTTYTATIKGGSAGVKDAAGNALAADRTWTFTTAAAGGGGTSETVTLTATADSYVTSGAPTTNFGTSTLLGVDNSPVEATYLKFDLSAYAGRTLESATLQLRSAGSGSTGTQNVKLVTNDGWTESGTGAITYNNRPLPLATSLGTLGPTTTNTNYTVTLTAGSLAGELGGQLSLALDSSSSDGLDLNSKEAGATAAPKLVITLSAGGGGGTPSDTTAPETTITSGPPETSTSTSASFAFTSSEANSTFQCSLDNAPRVACTSPRTYTGLSIGSHTFRVWATDAAGNTDTTEATQTWSVASGGGTSETVTLTATADSYVTSGAPTTNFGTSTLLGVDNSPVEATYLKFDLSAYAGRTLESATLQLRSAGSGSTGTQNVKLVTNDGWTESGTGAITYNNRPLPVGTSLGTLGPTTTNTNYTVTLTAGSLAGELGGLLSLALDSSSSDGLDLNSKEAGATAAPKLVITLKK